MAITEGVEVERVRDITNSEVSFFREHGYTVLRRLVSPEFVAKLRAAVKEFVDRSAVSDTTKSSKTHIAPAMAALPDPGPEDELLWAFSHSPALAAAHSRFLLYGGRVRFFRLEVYGKPPVRDGGAATPWHQDFPAIALDRSERPKIWLALSDTPQDHGAVRFLSGSHRAGALGRFFSGANILAEEDPFLKRYPTVLEEYPMSPPHDLAAGDATVHHALTVHSASTNPTGDVRWALATQYIASDAIYTGSQPCWFASTPGVTVGQPLDLPRFPIIPI